MIFIDKKKCKFCNNSFIPNSYSQKYCSSHCRKLNKILKDPQKVKNIIKRFKNKKQKQEKNTKEIKNKKTVNKKITIIINRYNTTKDNTLKNRIIDRRLTTYCTAPETIRRSVIDRDCHACYICGKKTGLHVHHIKPKAVGGKDVMENLVTLCSGCHRSIEAGDVENAIEKCTARLIKNKPLIWYN